VDLKGKISSGLRWSAATKTLSQIFTWSLTLVVIRLLEPEDYGLMAIVSSTIMLGAMVNELGLGAGLVQVENLTRTLKKQVFTIILIVSAGLYAVFFLSAPIIAKFYTDDRLVKLIQLMAFQLPLAGVASIPASLLLRDLEIKKKSVIEFVGNVVGGIVTLVLAFLNYGVWSLAVGTLVGVGTRVLGFFIARPINFLPTLSLKGVGKVASFGGLITTNKLLWFIYSRADVFIVGKLLGTEVLGYYSVAVELATLPSGRINSTVNEFAFPTFAKVQNDIERAKRFFVRGLEFTSLLGVPVFFGIAAVAPIAIEPLLGPQWVPIIEVLIIVCLVMPLRMTHNFLTTTLPGLGRVDITVANLLFACVVMSLAFYVGANYGITEVGLAWLFGFPVVLAFEIFASRVFMRVSYLFYWNTLWRSFASGLLMLMAVIGARLALEESLLAEFPTFFLTMLVLTGIGVYGATTIVLNRTVLKEAISFLKS